MAALVEGRLAGRIALVTGAANGIGRASAIRLAREGADLALVDREGDALNAVCPGAIRTRAHDRLPREVIDKVRNSVPMGYVAEPEDVAGVVAFLASDDARYITGQSILIDGGRWMI